MSYVADITVVEARLGTYVGESQECVASVKRLAGAPQTRSWVKGKRVKGETIPVGTGIATFNQQNKYQGHAAIYISQDADGICVYDQWKRRPLNKRLIAFRGSGYVSNDGDQFYVIE